MGTTAKSLHLLSDFEKHAKELVSPGAWNYFAHGAGSGFTLRRNIDAFKHFLLRPKVMRDVSKRDLSVTILGSVLDFPIITAPVTSQDKAHPDGEIATARATTALNTCSVISTWASKGLEDVAKATPEGLKWFQVHPFKNREITVKTLVKKAEEAGYKAIVVTIDSRVLGREFGIFIRSGDYEVNPPSQLPNVNAVFADFDFHDASSTWEFLHWLKKQTSLPIVVKGILTPEAAMEACNNGADAVVVSNQGARHLDGTASSIEVLAEIVDAVGDRCDVYMDGGVRSGGDVLKALAIGAKLVLVGRPVLWGLACGGEEGVRRVLEILREELSIAMGLCGCATIKDIDRTIITKDTYYLSKPL